MFFFNTFIKLVDLIYDYVDKEINDEGKLQQKLMEARLNYEMDMITEEEYKELEAILIREIARIREQKMEEKEESEYE